MDRQGGRATSSSVSKWIADELFDAVECNRFPVLGIRSGQHVDMSAYILLACTDWRGSTLLGSQVRVSVALDALEAVDREFRGTRCSRSILLKKPPINIGISRTVAITILMSMGRGT